MVSSTQVFCILFALILPSVLSQVYNVNMACGTCQSTTGCTGDMCIKFTGDITAEYCYGSATCNINGNQTFSMGQCAFDASGASCPSGICAMGASMQMCYGSAGGVCLDGVSYNQTCSNGQITISMIGGSFGNSAFSTTVPINMTCPFTKATGNYSTCSGDALGTACNCCFSTVIQGMSSVLGTCIPQDSPIIQAKSSMNKSGFQYIFSLALILLQLLFIAF